MKQVWRLFQQGKALLTRGGRRILYLYGIVLVLLAGLDAIAMFLVSRIFTSSSTTDNAIEISSGTSTLLFVVVLFISKTVMSTTMSWITIKRLAQEEVQIGSNNFHSLMNSKWDLRVDSEITSFYNGVDRGPSNLVQGFLVNVVTIFAEACNASLILLALLILEPTTALIATLYFLVVAVIQHKVLSVSASRAGNEVVQHTNRVYGLLTDVFHLNKLLSIHRSQSLDSVLNQERQSLAFARSKVAFLGTLPRYFMELVLAVGLGIIAAITYAISGTQGAIAALTVFTVAGFRLLPIVNRIQGLILMLFSTLPSADLAFVTSEPTESVTNTEKPTDGIVLCLQNVTYSYPKSTMPALSNVNLSLVSGLQYAIVGPSGAGKTTLIDVCLGLLNPQHGRVLRTHDSRIAYVPQDTYIAQAQMAQNISLEWSNNVIDDEAIDESCRAAQLEALFLGGEDKRDLNSRSLSGGQKQRIGLARALYRKPTLLFLDEVTSALDAETEHAVMQSIHSLRGSTTVVIVAHRLSTVQHADQVIYIGNGEVLGVGTFEELRKTIPALQRQIELGTLGLLN